MWYNSKMIIYHSTKTRELLTELKTTARGLSSPEAALRLKQHGENRLPEAKPVKWLVILGRQFQSPFIYILLAAGAVSILVKEYTDAQIIIGAMLINVLIGFFQEYKANKSLAALKKMVPRRSIVIRDNAEQEIDSINLVPGDVIILQMGHQVPADCRLLTAVDFEVNEAILTGESAPVKKQVEALPAGTVLADRNNMIYSSTVVVGGSAQAIVVGTGMKTEFGKIAELVKDTSDENTPLQQRLVGLSKFFGIVTGIVCVLIVTFGYLQGRNLFEIFITAIAIAVAAIPEGLSVAVTVILVLGMSQIVKRQALVRHLIAAETLGSITVICSDKTGTLTEGKMKVSHVLVGNNKLELNGGGPPEKVAPDIFLALEIGALCNNAIWQKANDELAEDKVIGSPLEIALLEFAHDWGIDREKLNNLKPRVGELPFNSAEKIMITVHRIKKDGFVLYEKGAPEIILANSSHYLENGQVVKLGAAEKKYFNRQFKDWTSRGLRLIALAYRDLKEYDSEQHDLRALGHDLVFTSLIAVKDPLRPEARETIETCRQAGIRPIIITGDHPLTALAIAKEAGFKADTKVAVGEELEKINDKDLKSLVKKVDIFARATPSHKLRIVKALRANGEVVAMTGDGLNDSPALKAADIGVCLGSGTEVAKETSDIVLLDNNFKVIVAAIEEGRIIFQNIRKSITYLTSDCFSEIILISACILWNTPLAVLPVQILWINIINDGFPNFSLAFERSDKNLMQQKPLKRVEPLMNRQVKGIVLWLGIIRDIALAAIFIYGYYHLEVLGCSLEYWRTMFFAMLGFKSITGIFSLRNLNLPIWKINHLHNRYLLLAFFLSGGLLVAAIYFAPLQNLLKTVPLSLNAWLLISGVALINIFLVEVIKLIFRPKLHEKGK